MCLFWGCISIFPVSGIFLNIKRFSNSHKKKVTNGERLQVLETGRVFVPEGARVCKNHRTSDEFWEAAWQVADLQYYNAGQIESMIDLARSARDRVPTVNIDIANYTGLSIQQFEELLLLVPSLTTTTTSAVDAKNALLMLLIRFRKAATYEYIAKLFDVSTFKVSTNIKKARNALNHDFVPNWLGFANLGRECLLQNTTMSARLLHGNGNADTVITIWDGTYIYVYKSSNYEFQKDTYNGQKKRNFLRPMVCVTTNGYIVDILGPFEATKNDAKCMRTILNGQPEVKILRFICINNIQVLSNTSR